MFVKLFNARLTDYAGRDRTEEGSSQRSSVTQEETGGSGSSPSYHFLSPCSSPAIRQTESVSSLRRDLINDCTQL